MAKIVTNTNIDEIMSSDIPVLIDFWAAWCGPCRMISPIIDEISQEYEGKALVAKCNVDDADEIAAQFRIRSIPTLVFIKNGEIVDRQIGASSKDAITAKLDAII